MLKLAVLLTQMSSFGCYFVQPHGPTHKRLASECIEEIVAGVFNYKYFDYNTPLLLTFMVTIRTDSPTYEIQEQVLRKLHNLKEWPIEVLRNSRNEFQPFLKRTFNDNEERYNHVPHFKTSMYVIVVDNMEAFERKLRIIKDSSSFNPHATYVIYFGMIEPESKDIIVEILTKLMSLYILDVLMIVPNDLTVFSLYRLDINAYGPLPCGSNPKLMEITKCVKGDLVDKRPRYFKYMENNYLNCSMPVIATLYQPFVINDNSGFEVDLLRQIGNILNLYFNITVLDDHEPWGAKEEYGNWSGPLEVVYSSLSLGVGNVPIESEYLQDFAFSIIYFTESMVWIIPRAEFVERWMVLFVIFTLQVWGICLTVFLGYAIIFFLSAKFGNEVNVFRSFTNSFISSFEMLISSATPVQPITDITRVFFVSLAVFSIIISSVYTSSLVFYLTHPIRKYQIKTGREIWQSSFGLGGTTKYRQVFNSSNPEILKAFNAFVVNEEHDNELYWIEQVANSRNICTISSNFFVKYLISTRHNVTTDEYGNQKVFVSPQQVFTNFIAIIMRKGHPLRSNINRIISILITGGFVEHYTQKYMTKIKKSQDIHTTDSGNSRESLTLEHLQGAFSLLLLGYVAAAFTFVIELVRKLISYYCCKRKKIAAIKKRKVKFVGYRTRGNYRNVTFTSAPTAYNKIQPTKFY